MPLSPCAQVEDWNTEAATAEYLALADQARRQMEEDDRAYQAYLDQLAVSA